MSKQRVALAFALHAAGIALGCGGGSQIVVRELPSTPRAISELKRGWADAVDAPSTAATAGGVGCWAPFLPGGTR